MVVGYVIATIAAIAFIGSLTMLVIRTIKRKTKKSWLIVLSASFGLFIAGVVIGGATTDKPVATSDIPRITSSKPTPTVTLKPTPKMTLAQEYKWLDKQIASVMGKDSELHTELEIRYKRLRMLAESLAPKEELERIEWFFKGREIDFSNKKQVDFFLRMSKERDDLLARVLEANPDANLPSDDDLYDWGIRNFDLNLAPSAFQKLKLSESPEEYKQSARSNISYGELLRNTKQYEGKRVTYQGEVVQIVSKAVISSDTFLMALRVDIAAKEYGFGDVVLVTNSLIIKWSR